MRHDQPPSNEHRKRSREEIAKEEIGHTDATRGVNWLLTLGFLAVIVAVPLIQTVVELRAILGSSPEPSEGAIELTRDAELARGRSVPQSWDVAFFLLPSPTEVVTLLQAGSVSGMFEAGRTINNRILRDIERYERDLKDRDVVIQWLIPRMQTVLTGWLRGGNEDAYCGRDGWLFYRRDIDSLTSRGFLEPDVLAARAASGSELKEPPQPDPVKAIVDFRDQLAARGITLVVMPTPVKPSVYPEQFSARYTGHSAVIHNPSYEAFIKRLASANVPVFDPAPLLMNAKRATPELPLYLATDTHWTPPAMELTAQALAARTRELVSLPPAASSRFTTVEQSVTNLGDVAMMLDLPAGQKFFPSETVTLRQVLDRGQPWRADPNAEVLFLGDSFANIYSLEAMRWGGAAGLAEHLSLALGLPVDAILRNDAGSHATREMLAADLARGRNRLAGKKIVIWEFASRELAFGDWKMTSLELGEKRESGDIYAPAPGASVEIRGVVRGASAAPRPGSVPYKDHILMLHLADIESTDDSAAQGKEAVVLTWSMQDNRATVAAQYRPGDVVHLRMVPWDDVASQHEAINRSELDDERLLAASWGWAGNGPEIAIQDQAAKPAVETRPVDQPLLPPSDDPVDQAATSPGPVTAESFRALCAKLAADGDSMAVPGHDGWLFLRSELRHIGAGRFWGDDAAKVSKATSAGKADPLPAIVDFNEQLKAAGIELVLMPVPCKAFIYPEKLDRDTAERLDTDHQAFFALLREKGVKVLDLADVFLKTKATPDTPLLYCKTDTHWSPYACEVAARAIKELLGTPDWLRGKTDAFTTTPETFVITGDLTDGQGSEELAVRFVKAAGAALEDKTSPIVILGDSHNLVFHSGADMHGTGAGLADQLAAELGLAVDVVAVRGSGATPARKNLSNRSKANAEYLTGKKVIIWCFTEREFTESGGWSLVPIRK